MKQKSHSVLCGFTIVELLIVVSIIVILAAIVTENVLAAQIRAKIARCHSDLRTLSIGIEIYHTDNHQYPRMAHWKFYGDPNFDIVDGEKASGIMSKALSTPIAYVTQAQIMDPFMATDRVAPIDERMYTYQVIGVYSSRNPKSKFWGPAGDFFGGWRLIAVGPDRLFDHGFVNSGQLPYDPTNGIISFGNLWRSPGGNEQRMPPVPLLLGAH